MTQYSANLGFLWTELSLPDAIRAAANAGFHAVECHWPYDEPVEAVCAALTETGLPMLGLNTRRGGQGENGLSALPGREDEADAAVDEALAYARATGTRAVHVMAGFADPNDDAARIAFERCLSRVCALAAEDEITILIEPLNRHDAPGYFLANTQQAAEIVDAVNAPNLKLMFDCYHVGRTEGDITTRLAELLDKVGHIQFASVPSRGAPDQGEVNYAYVFEKILSLGWNRPLGAEYKPGKDTNSTLNWMSQL